MRIDRGWEEEEQWKESKKEEEEGGPGEGPVGFAEEAAGDGEEHHGAPSVQPGGHQCTKVAPGHQTAAGTLPLPVRLYHHLEQALTRSKSRGFFHKPASHLREELKGWSSPCLCRFPATDTLRLRQTQRSFALSAEEDRR